MTLAAAIRREAVYLSHIVRTLLLLAPIKPASTRTIVDAVEKQARATPDAPAIYYLDEVMSYGALDARANAYGHWALGEGLTRGDCVALFMENRPDFLCCWLGLFKAGLSVALINTNQRGQALAHSIEIAGARHLIAGAELAAFADEAKPFFTAAPAFWSQGGVHSGMRDMDASLARMSTASLGKAPRRERPVHVLDVLCEVEGFDQEMDEIGAYILKEYGKPEYGEDEPGGPPAAAYVIFSYVPLPTLTRH